MTQIATVQSELVQKQNSLAKRCTNKKGFTLVELVIVIAILAILAAIAIPVVSSIINTASRNTALTDAQTLEMAIKEAQADIVARNGDTYPKAGKGTAVPLSDVATAKGLTTSFRTREYNLNGTATPYVFYWDAGVGKVILLPEGATTTDTDINNVAPTGDITALYDADGTDNNIADVDDVRDLKSPRISKTEGTT